MSLYTLTKQIKNIKENRNLCGFNLWSGTDYSGVVSSEKTDDIQFACTQGLNSLSSSNEWGSNFEKSIKSNLPSGEYSVFFKYNLDTNHTYVASVDVCSKCNGVLYFIARDQNTATNTIIKSASFTPTSTPATLTSTITPSEFTGSETQLQIRIANQSAGIIYTDNWRLIYS